MFYGGKKIACTVAFVRVFFNSYRNPFSILISLAEFTECQKTVASIYGANLNTSTAFCV